MGTVFVVLFQPPFIVDDLGCETGDFAAFLSDLVGDNGFFVEPLTSDPLGLKSGIDWATFASEPGNDKLKTEAPMFLRLVSKY